MSVLALAEETGGLRLPLSKLILWALGLCFFGVVFAVPLRKEVIVREKLKFPSGTATALMVGVLHGGEKTGAEGEVEEQTIRRRKSSRNGDGNEESQALIGDASPAARQSGDEDRHDGGEETASKRDWQAQIRLLTYSFGVSGGYVRLQFYSHLNIHYMLMDIGRPSSPTSSPKSTVFPSSAPISPTNGFGN